MAKTISPRPSAQLRVDGDGFATPLQPGEGPTAILPAFGERTQYFMLGHGAKSWELAQIKSGWRLIPVLSRLVVRAGVNWTRAPEHSGGKLDSSDLEAKAKSRLEMTVIQDEAAYLARYPGRDGTTGHFLRWERIRPYEDGTFELSWDQAGYDEWRWSLVTSGLVQPPREEPINKLRHRLTQSRQRALRTPHLEQAKEAVASAELRLKGLVEAVAVVKKIKDDKVPGRAVFVPAGGDE